MTPRMLDALLKRKDRERVDAEFLFAQLASVFVNYSMAAPKKAVPPSDFMPSEILKKSKFRGPSKEERLAIDRQARAFISAMMKQQQEGDSGETKVHHS